MKKNKFKSLKLRKESISKLDQAIIGGVGPAETCEGPCQNGTTCCNGGGGNGEACFSHNGALSCGWICIGGEGYTNTWSSATEQ